MSIHRYSLMLSLQPDLHIPPHLNDCCWPLCKPLHSGQLLPFEHFRKLLSVRPLYFATSRKGHSGSSAFANLPWLEPKQATL